MGEPAVPLPWVAQLFAILTAVWATVKTALQPLQEQVDKLTKEVQELRDDQEKLRTAFEGECTVTFLHNKAVVAHMKGVNEQLEEIKKTLDYFKTEVDPQKIPKIF
ncbi:hypothetical protein CJ030_MR4G013732 [Morella rubra]|uniref:Uncharacterized protein n=1 Tax=Morella rubra TaxID=262757 RepID=A0A6A1X027_9ROSI|nr:hypothetical protein CJ030_MR4G013732 [Morella rubra]